MKAVLDEILALVAAPIEIPLISDLYKAITGDQLSLLDLIAFLVAIPTTIIAKLVNALSTPEAGAPSTKLGWSDDTSAKIANGIGLIIGGIIDSLATLASVPDAGPVLRKFFGFLKVISLGHETRHFWSFSDPAPFSFGFNEQSHFRTALGRIAPTGWFIQRN